MKDNLKFRVLQLTSGHFLCKNIPDNWYELSHYAQNQFLNENVWQPLEGLDSNLIWETIENSALVTQKFIENLKGDSHD